MRNRRALPLLALALLCAAAYGRALTLPLFEDDFPLLTFAQRYGPLSSIDQLFQDEWPLPRATMFWLMLPLWKLFGVHGFGFHLVSLAIHVLNTFLLYGLCLIWAPMRRAAFWAAAFFAVHEGHQEAVMWFASVNELLMFLFGVASLLCWMKKWPAAGLATFALALLSKETAVIFLPLFYVVTPREEFRSRIAHLIPHVGAALAMLAWIASSTGSFRLSDGSFSLSAPFWITWPNSYARLLWIWGVAALAWLAFARKSELWKQAVPALAWIGVAMIPYSFLMYMTRLPSRHVYLASAGLAMLVGLAMTDLAAKRKNAALVVAAVVVAHNVGYIATRKHRQFVERAAPTEQLIVLAKRTSGPIFVQCFPRAPIIAEEAVRLAAGRSPDTLLWKPPEQAGIAVFCYR